MCLHTHSPQEVIEIARNKLPGYEAKIRSFYEEHIHSDEEIRYILGGTGVFVGLACVCLWAGAAGGVSGGARPDNRHLSQRLTDAAASLTCPRPTAPTPSRLL
jgi:hypothetical protein